jgi:tetratricopeptide (TPR) repeat protein
MLDNNNQALKQYSEAVRLNPVNGGYLQRLGLAFSRLEQYERADRLLQTGIHYERRNPDRYKTYSSWLFSRGEKEAALGYMEKAISLEPGKTRDYIALMVIQGLNDEEILSALPERVGPYLHFADFLDVSGKEKLAGSAYLEGLRFCGNEKQVSPKYFYKVYRYFMNKTLYEDALDGMKRGIECIPEHAGIRATTAELYEQKGILYRAIDEYKRALIIDPQNRRAKRGLERLDSENR